MLQAGRRKAYRPLDPQRRRDALEAALAAFERGDYFEAHELLEPAWMGTADLAERALYQGLIKLAAAYVHRVRGNPLGMANNLRGARLHLSAAAESPVTAAIEAGLDPAAIVAAIDERLEVLAHLPAAPARAPGSERFPTREPVAGVPDAPVLRSAD